jgi:hypothetical protein
MQYRPIIITLLILAGVWLIAASALKADGPKTLRHTVQLVVDDGTRAFAEGASITLDWGLDASTLVAGKHGWATFRVPASVPTAQLNATLDGIWCYDELLQLDGISHPPARAFVRDMVPCE